MDNAYYGKDKEIWDTIPKQASWIMQKIIKARQLVEETGYDWEGLQGWKQFSTKMVYQKIRGTFQKVPWKRLVCNNYGCPKWIFILRLVAHGRLSIKDRLVHWGLNVNPFCPICECLIKNRNFGQNFILEEPGLLIIKK